MIHAGDHVVDTEQPADEQSTAVVIKRPGLSAAEYDIDAQGTTVADVNPGCEPSDAVVVVVFPQRTATGIAGSEYAYPVSRLAVVASVHGDADTDAADVDTSEVRQI